MAKPIPLDSLPVFGRNSRSFPDSGRFLDGLAIPFDKPSGWSSFDVVSFVRNRIPVRKVGHAGTLDPLANGLLVLCCGKATKSVTLIQQAPKTYIAEITLGAATPSYDAATDISETCEWSHITRTDMSTILKDQFSGTINQVPPVYSALWKDGQRMYKLARKGIPVEATPRKVVLHEVEILDFSLPKVTCRIVCGKGFYVRSLAFDLGRALGSAGYLSSLRRTHIGHYTVDEAWTCDQFNEWSLTNG